MRSLCSVAGPLLSGLGVALLICSLLLVPDGRIFGQEGEPWGLDDGCDPTACDSACSSQAAYTCTDTGTGGGTVCTAVAGKTCSGCGCRANQSNGNCHCRIVN
jgi:hypothetical protein